MLAVALLAGTAVAQRGDGHVDLRGDVRSDATTRDPLLLRQELARMRQEHSRARALEQRLVDLRIRHDLGLRVDAQTYFARSEVEQAIAKADAEQQLADTQHQLGTLQQSFGELQQRIERRRSNRPATASTDPPFAPLASTAPSFPYAVPPLGAQDPAAAALQYGGGFAAAAPLAETRPSADGLGHPGMQRGEPPHAAELRPQQPQAVPAPRTPPRPAVLIHGSRDHSAVGRALFEAGEYEKARDELLLLQKDGGTMVAVDLFYLARCHERIGERGAADSAFAKVEALDTKEGPDGKMVPGHWAQAARISRQQMNWEAEKGGWRPSRSIESIQWRRP